jgi:hypothetical protein
MAIVGKRKGAYRGLVGIPEAKTPFGRISCRWEYNKMNLRK